MNQMPTAFFPIGGAASGVLTGRANGADHEAHGRRGRACSVNVPARFPQKTLAKSEFLQNRLYCCQHLTCVASGVSGLSQDFIPKKEHVMAVATSHPPKAKDWKDLYVAALLEGDKDKIPFLIDQAERAIVDRARELFQTQGDHIQEEEGLEDALYALHALKTCLATHGRFAEAA
jgi:hypothetical protein